MTTPEFVTPDAGGGQPLSTAELARLANQIFAQLPSGQPASPPRALPVAPRGSVPDTTSVASAGHTLGSVPSTPFGAPPSDFVGGVPAVLPPLASYASTAAPYAERHIPAVTTAWPTSVGHIDAPTLADPALTVPSVSDLIGDWTVADRAPQRPDAPKPDHQRGTPTGHEVFDVASVRADFPILAERVNGHQLIWFDNAATTQKPRPVIERISAFYEHENSNIHRAAHELAARSTDAYEDARETVRRFLGASKIEEVVFVRGATEGINLVAQSWGPHNLGPGDEILITHLEHHANIVPWQIVAQRTGAVLKVAPVDDSGTLLLEEFTRLLTPRTKLVAATHVANAVGTVSPVQHLVEIAHRAGARVLIDGAQSVPHLAVDLQALGADFFVFSGHKVFGPTGIGAVYISERVWQETPAWHGGGNMIADVTVERSIYQGPPNKYEAGTGNIADAVGLGAALRYVEGLGIERVAAYEHELLEYATPRLAAVTGVRLVGTSPEKASVLSFVLDGYEPAAVGAALNERGIAVRAGHHCAQPILRRLGLEQTVRPSFAVYNTFDEIDVFIEAVQGLASRPR